LKSLGLTWTRLISHEPTWTHVNSFELIWTHLNSLGLIWTHLNSLECFWIQLSSLWVTWTHLNSLELTWAWAHLNSLELTWVNLNSFEVTSLEIISQQIGYSYPQISVCSIPLVQNGSVSNMFRIWTIVGYPYPKTWKACWYLYGLYSKSYNQIASKRIQNKDKRIQKHINTYPTHNVRASGNRIPKRTKYTKNDPTSY
jgi:hypothetical protein